MVKAKRYILLIMCLCVFLSGCSQGEHKSAPAGSMVWETMPALTYGVLESEKLQVLDWNSGRCEATSRDEMAETEAGFYYLSRAGYFNKLYYCDKAAFGNWFYVCNAPDCGHTPTSGCAALPESSSFVVKDDRIFYLARASAYPELYMGGDNGHILISCAANGTDIRLEYVLEDAMLTGGGSYSTRLTSRFWLYSSSKLTPEGQYELKTFLVNANGSHLVYSGVSDTEKNAILAPVNVLYGFQGENAYFNEFTDSSLCYRVAGDTLEPVDLSGLETGGAYLSGNVLRCFKQNDGYYDVDLTTREEIRLADARMENSHCQIVLPNCIVESTLLTGLSLKDRTEGMTHALEIFDGERWRSVTLPPELEEAGTNVFIYVAGVTSDSILFHCGGMGIDGPCYKIMLDADNLTMEACGMTD